MLKDQLGILIKETLDNLVPDGASYVLTDLPYHLNIGGLLIWEGTRQYFNYRKDMKCLGLSSSFTFNFPDLSEDTIIFLNGGGSFGDLWAGSQQFRLKLVAHYKNNKIIILPQSIHYTDNLLMLSDFNQFNKYKNTYFCFRDLPSFNLALRHLNSSRVFLVPDMALLIDTSAYVTKKKVISDKLLYIKREDKEWANKNILLPRDKIKIKDWPSFNSKNPNILLFRLLLRLNHMCLDKGFNDMAPILDIYCNKVLRPTLIKMGVNFISNYDTVITFRLHGLILSFLLDRKIFFVDNLTQKLSAFVDTWLTDCKNIKKLG